MRTSFRTIALVFGREFRAYFATPLAAVFLLVFLSLSAGLAFFAGGFFERGQADLGPFFYEPTVLADVTDEMTCYGEETFGPVVSIYPVDSPDEAIKLANATRYGLNASVFAGSSAEANAKESGTSRCAGGQLRREGGGRIATLVDYVWSRPIGEPEQEVGGVMVTLAAYCLAADLDMHAAGETELARILQQEPRGVLGGVEQL